MSCPCGPTRAEIAAELRAVNFQVFPQELVEIIADYADEGIYFDDECGPSHTEPMAFFLFRDLLCPSCCCSQGWCGPTPVGDGIGAIGYALGCGVYDE